MSINKLYRDFLEINNTFESVVDIDADKRNSNLWREYIVGEDMEKLVDLLCQSLGNEAPDARRSFWIWGSYGTGKSYAAIFVKHLLEEKPDDIEIFVERSSRLAKYRRRLMKVRGQGEFLVVWKTGCTGIRTGDVMLFEAEQAIKNALIKKYGDRANLGSASLIDAIISKLKDPSINWDFIIENSILSDDYASFEELLDDIEQGNIHAVQMTAQVIREKGYGLINNLTTFQKWLTEIIRENNLKGGIFFIWDEFTEYVVHSEDRTIMQQISEFCKVQPFFMMYVVHHVINKLINSAEQAQFQRIMDRFHDVEFQLKPDAALDLIAGSISVRSGMGINWNTERKQVVKDMKKFLPDIGGGVDSKISEMIDNLCPIHPMTIRLLTRVSDNFAAAQRTMFRFMKDQSVSDVGFVYYINNYGPGHVENCWLTPEYLWDYFFTRKSDYSNKDINAATYIQHYEENAHLLVKSANALRIFKIVMLLLTLSSTTKGMYGFSNSKDPNAIKATQEDVCRCLAGVLGEDRVKDLLSTLRDQNLVLQEQDPNGTVRLQLPFKGGSNEEFLTRFEDNDRKYTRYKMFEKDGFFSDACEREFGDETDAFSKRLKLAVCCAETNSINSRLREIKEELSKFPYKIGLLIVTVKDETQAMAAQKLLAELPALAEMPRLVVALLKDSFTDESRKNWLTYLTRAEQSAEAGFSAAKGSYKTEVDKIINNWVQGAKEHGKFIAWNGSRFFTNIYGLNALRNTIKQEVFNVLFPYSLERIVSSLTAYKPCNDSAPLAGINRKGPNTQLQSVLNSLPVELISLTKIDELAEIDHSAQFKGDKAAQVIGELARTIRDRMIVGRRIDLENLWETLQREPFGFYNTIACAILLGIVFSCYKNGVFSWTDNVQNTHALNDSMLKTLIIKMCRGQLNNDYLSAGSAAFQQFREYTKQIIKLSDSQTANETELWHNMRFAIGERGVPLWALKYLPEGYGSKQKTAEEIIDGLQQFMDSVSDREAIMNKVVNSFYGCGKVKMSLVKAFADKQLMTESFRRFLYSSAPELEMVTASLSLQSIDLSDRLRLSMQTAVYTWTEQQVKDKLTNIVNEYQYLIEINKAVGEHFRSLEKARYELANRFKYTHIPLAAVENFRKPWGKALKALYALSQGKLKSYNPELLADDISSLREYGNDANSFLIDCKPFLSEILEAQNIEHTSQNIEQIYKGLNNIAFNSSFNDFKAALDLQIKRLDQARRRIELREQWNIITGKDSVKKWCDNFRTPVFWIASRDMQKALHTVIEVQSGKNPQDDEVIFALQVLKKNIELLNSASKIKQKLSEVIGADCIEYFEANSEELIRDLKFECGNDMSTWLTPELSRLQAKIKKAKQEQAIRNELREAKDNVRLMNDRRLRECVVSFLEKHPEFCGHFLV
ncbi:MAG: hypothetical protein ACI376_04570 [Candidatus Bruticola sp.]